MRNFSAADVLLRAGLLYPFTRDVFIVMKRHYEKKVLSLLERAGILSLIRPRRESAMNPTKSIVSMALTALHSPVFRRRPTPCVLHPRERFNADICMELQTC
jgi:hypothetical protein